MDRADCRGAGGWCCSFSREGLIIIIRRQQFIDAKLSNMSICILYDFSVSKFNSFIDKLNFYLYLRISLFIY
jgi:hypothetical protein